MCALRRFRTATAARNRSGAHFRRGESGQYGRTRRSLTLQPTAFPEVESLLEGLRKRLRMPAAWAAKDGIQPGLTAVNDGKAVNERDVLILLTEVNLEKPAIRYRTKYAEKRTKHTIFRTIICKNRTDNQKYHYLCSHQRWRI